jgi:CDP-paratose 2-epimerase
MRCTMTTTRYSVLGYGGKQVRDVIHSHDVLSALELYCNAPRPGEVYNLGGGRDSNVSVLEAIELCQRITGRELDWEYKPENRIGDHIWWISDMAKFREHYPSWEMKYDVPRIAEELYADNLERWVAR